MKLKVKPCKYCNEHAIETSRCPDINPMEPVRMLCTKCNFQIYGATEEEAIRRWNKEYDLAHRPKGVMIRGIEMPKSCFECPCLNTTVDHSGDCILPVFISKCAIKDMKVENQNDSPSWCPLKEVK